MGIFDRQTGDDRLLRLPLVWVHANDRHQAHVGDRKDWPFDARDGFTIAVQLDLLGTSNDYLVPSHACFREVEFGDDVQDGILLALSFRMLRVIRRSVSRRLGYLTESEVFQGRMVLAVVAEDWAASLSYLF